MKKLIVITVIILVIALLFVWNQNQMENTTEISNPATEEANKQSEKQPENRETEVDVAQNNNNETSNINVSEQDSNTGDEMITKTVIISGLVRKPSGGPLSGCVFIYITTLPEEGESHLTGKTVGLDQLGKFTAEIAYKAFPHQKCNLSISTSTSTIENSDGIKPAYCKPQQFTIQEPEELINVVFESLQTSTLIAKVTKADPYNKHTYPEFILEITEKDWVRDRQYGFVYSPIIRGKSQIEGRFVVPSGCSMKLIASMRGYPDSTVMIEPLSPGETREVSITMRETGIKLFGRCEDINGRPIKGINVIAVQEGISNFLKAKTDSNGTFIMENILDKPLKYLEVYTDFNSYNNKYNSKILNNVDINQELTIILEEKGSSQ